MHPASRGAAGFTTFLGQGLTGSVALTGQTLQIWLAESRVSLTDIGLFALVEAEELGVTSKNVDEMLKSSSPNIQRLLGQSGGFGKMIGLEDRWAYNAIKAVVNYGEIFDRNLGKDSPLGLPRGINALWNKGGLIYAPPIR